MSAAPLRLLALSILIAGIGDLDHYLSALRRAFKVSQHQRSYAFLCLRLRFQIAIKTHGFLS
jgi:hypothetical protein